MVAEGFSHKTETTLRFLWFQLLNQGQKAGWMRLADMEELADLPYLSDPHV